MSHIIIIGSGVVGQATGKGFAKKGHRITFVDVNPDTRAKLTAEGHTALTTHEVDWSAADIAMLTVPTPTINGTPSVQFLKEAALDAGTGLRHATHFVVVVVRSTALPTTTEKIITPILEQASGKKAGVDFGVVMNPEFLRQNNSEQDFARPWITVVGCSDAHSEDIMEKLYRPFGALIVYCTPTEAEMIKFTSNIYNAVKISYFNEVHQLSQRLGIDSNLVGATVARTAEGMWNPLYGTRGGVPYGGACLPKDTEAFLHFSREMGFEHLVLEATIHANKRLSAHIKPANSPDKMDESLQAAQPAPEIAHHNGVVHASS
jgi:UDPglucose 6-dehydrogenase